MRVSVTKNVSCMLKLKIRIMFLDDRINRSENPGLTVHLSFWPFDHLHGKYVGHIVQPHLYPSIKYPRALIYLLPAECTFSVVSMHHISIAAHTTQAIMLAESSFLSTITLLR